MSSVINSVIDRSLAVESVPVPLSIDARDSACLAAYLPGKRKGKIRSQVDARGPYARRHT